MQFIARKDALQMMSQKNYDGSPFVFSITFITANRLKKTGGKIKTLQKATLNSQYNKHLAQLLAPNNNTPKEQKTPNNRENFTINLLNLETNEIIKVHTELITRINDLKIIP